MKGKDFKKFLGLQLVDIADTCLIGGISFIFKDKKEELIGFTIYPDKIKHCEVASFKIKT